MWDAIDSAPTWPWRRATKTFTTSAEAYRPRLRVLLAGREPVAPDVPSVAGPTGLPAPRGTPRCPRIREGRGFGSAPRCLPGQLGRGYPQVGLGAATRTQ